MFSVHIQIHHFVRSLATVALLSIMAPSPQSSPAQQDNEPANPKSVFIHGLTGVDVPLDTALVHWLWGTMGLLVLIVLCFRFGMMLNAHLRHMSTLTATSKQQTYWAINHTSIWPKFKKHILLAPFWKRRHNRELKITAAVGMGTLPSRLHAILLGLYAISNIVYCCMLDYSMEKEAIIAEARGRSGILAVANMVPLIVLAGRNNPLIPLLRVSFDTYNLLHRWFGRMVVVEALVHTGCWTANTVSVYDGFHMWQSVRSIPFITWGAVGSVGMCLLAIQALSPIRHAAYETFLHAHQLIAFFVVLAVYMHVTIDSLPGMLYIKAVIVLWALERFARFARLAYYNFSRSSLTKINVEALPGNTSRVTITLPRPMHVSPGSHVYLYIPQIAMWMSHPFSVAWTEADSQSAEQQCQLSKAGSTASNVSKKSQDPRDIERSPVTPVLPRSDSLTKRSLPLVQSTKFAGPCSQISLVIQAHTGMTKRLYEKAANAKAMTYRTTAFIEGPYGGHDKFLSYGTVLLFAGGIGITHQVQYVRHLLAAAKAGTSATRKITLVWMVRDTAHLEWMRPYMDSVLRMPGRREMLRVLLFITRPQNRNLIVSPSNTVLMYPGRPHTGRLIATEVRDRVGAMAISVCGPGALGDDVRLEARRWGGERGGGNVDFVEESFTW